jgi:endogenous inhibitor of DNA gyrase (YacG/DUF329 family)
MGRCKKCGKPSRRKGRCRDCVKGKTDRIILWKTMVAEGVVSSCPICGYATTVNNYCVVNDSFCCSKCKAHIDKKGLQGYTDILSDQKMMTDVSDKLVVVGVSDRKMRQGISVVAIRHDWDVILNMKGKAVLIMIERKDFGHYRSYELIDYTGDEDPEERYKRLRVGDALVSPEKFRTG